MVHLSNIGLFVWSPADIGKTRALVVTAKIGGMLSEYGVSRGKN